VILAYICIGWIASVLYIVVLRRENAAKARGARDEVIAGVDNKNADPRNGVFESVGEARREKGDAWSGFYYTL
jgi:hypothetical protein